MRGGALGETSQFFRIVGPTGTVLTAFDREGWLTWSNAEVGGTVIVEVADSLLPSNCWRSYVHHPVTGVVCGLRVTDPNPPDGMVLIPAGSFVMGNCMDPDEGSSNELPLHVVYVSAFYMDKHEVSKAKWDKVYSWATNHGYGFHTPFSGKAATHPVHTVNWYECVKWCNARSEKEGRVPAYYTSAAQTAVYRVGSVDVENDWVKWTAGGYRLPTEAEWEKAARGGLSGARFPWGYAITHDQANYYCYFDPETGHPYYAYDENAIQGYHPTYATGGQPYTSPVGSFAPNGYGLHGMAGNVWEWCWDVHSDTYYASSPGTDPRGYSPPYGGRELRGGTWATYGGAYGARCAVRLPTAPNYGCDSYTGFRCVR